MGLRLCHRSLDHNREHRARAGILQLYALCHPDHPASSRVLEKCGFRFEQRLEGACAESVLSPRDSDDTSNRASYADHWWRHIEGWREAEGDPILIPTLRESVEFRCDFAAGIIAPEYLLLILKSRRRLPECSQFPLPYREALENSPDIRLQRRGTPSRSAPPLPFH